MTLRRKDPRLDTTYSRVLLTRHDLEEIVGYIREDAAQRGAPDSVRIEVEEEYLAEDVADLLEVNRGRLRQLTIRSKYCSFYAGSTHASFRVYLDDADGHVMHKRVDAILRARVSPRHDGAWLLAAFLLMTVSMALPAQAIFTDWPDNDTRLAVSIGMVVASPFCFVMSWRASERALAADLRTDNFWRRNWAEIAAVGVVATLTGLGVSIVSALLD